MVQARGALAVGVEATLDVIAPPLTLGPSPGGDGPGQCAMGLGILDRVGQGVPQPFP